MEQNEKCCCFTGHRPEKLPWGENESDLRCMQLKQNITDLLDSLYHDGFRHFYCGMANGCDRYFGEAVIALRAEHPEVLLDAVIPYEGQAENWSPSDRTRYFRLAAECDRQIILHKSYTPDCMMERNRYMVDRSDLLVAVYAGIPGGTRNTMLYAMRQSCEILQISI